MHTIKITPNLLFEYQCTSGKFIRLPNRIESKLSCPNWNGLATAAAAAAAAAVEDDDAVLALECCCRCC